MRRNVIVGILIAIVILVLCFAWWYHTRVGAAPWQETGTLIVAVRAVPTAAQEDHTMRLGIDDLVLKTAAGDTSKASIRMRRITLDPAQHDLSLLLDTESPVGTYTALTFTLRSPELRNAWEGDTPPQHVTLPHETISIPVRYVVREGETTALILGFETLQAIRNDDDTRAYLPVIQVETRSNTKVTHEGDTVTIESGTIEHNATYGMNWKGLMRQNFRERNRNTEPKDTTHRPTLPDNVLDKLEDVAQPEASTTTLDKTATTTATSSSGRHTASTTTSDATSDGQTSTSSLQSGP